MIVALTDVQTKCTTVLARLKKLLRFVTITGLAMIAIFMLAGQPLTRSGCGIAFFMLVMLAATSVFIAFHFDWWFVGPLLNVQALFSTPALLGREFSTSLGALVGVCGLLSIGAALGYIAFRRHRWEEEAGISPDQWTGWLLEAPVPPEKRRFRLTNLGPAERFAIESPAHASIFALMIAAQRAWTRYDVQRLEEEIARRGAWELYLQLEGTAFRATAVDAFDARPPWLKRAEDRIETWLESRFKDQGRFERLLKIAPTVSFLLALVLLLGSAVISAPVLLYAGAAEPATPLEDLPLWATLLASTFFLLLLPLAILPDVVLKRIQYRREMGIFPSRHPNRRGRC